MADAPPCFPSRVTFQADGGVTLNPAPCTLHPAPCTLHPEPRTLNLGHGDGGRPPLLPLQRTSVEKMEGGGATPRSALMRLPRCMNWGERGVLPRCMN